MRTGKIVAGLCLIAGAAVGSAACEAETFEVLASEECAIETAAEAVAQIAQAYAEIYWEGEVSTVTLDETTLSGVKDPELRDGFRHVAERLPEEAAWILMVHPFSEDYPTTLEVEVHDLNHPGLCCVIMSADIVRDDAGWRITSVDLGGFIHSFDEEVQKKRRARGAELRAREALR